MNWAEMIIGIVAIAGCVKIARMRFGITDDGNGGERHVGQAENDALRDEVRVLRERVQVLERLATDDTSARRLDQEIERLRDRT